MYRNGVLFGTTAATSLRVAPTLGLNGDIPGTGLMPGRANRVSVSAVTPSGSASIVSEIVVTTPGIAPAAPSAPPGLTVSRVRNNAIVLGWSPSTDGNTSVTEFAYEIFVNGIRQGPSCFQYCFGATGGSAINLAPGTTYRIGVRASNGATQQVSDLSEVTATTATP